MAKRERQELLTCRTEVKDHSLYTGKDIDSLDSSYPERKCHYTKNKPWKRRKG